MEKDLERTRDLFKEHIDYYSINIKKTAERLGYSAGHLWRVIHLKRDMTKELAEKLNAYFNTDF